jgi:hypothetical protein
MIPQNILMLSPVLFFVPKSPKNSTKQLEYFLESLGEIWKRKTPREEYKWEQ